MSLVQHAGADASTDSMLGGIPKYLQVKDLGRAMSQCAAERARGICPADDGGWPLLRRGNCQEERFWKSRADAAFVRPGVRTASPNNSTHSKRFDPITGPVDVQPRWEARWSRVAISDFAFDPNSFWGNLRRSLGSGLVPNALGLTGPASFRVGDTEANAIL